LDPRTGHWRAIRYGGRSDDHDVEPAWSPDSKMIAFTRYAIVGTYLDLEPKHVNRGIYVMKPNGADLHRIVKRGFQPAWSPDGRRIAYVRRVGGDAEIFVANANGTNQRRLTRNRGWDGEPDWQTRP